MIKGLYRSASGMLPQIKRQEVVANNLANASAPGFKKDMVFTKELSRAEARKVPRQSDWETPMIDQVYTKYEQGNFDQTGNPLDLAIEGDGFFMFDSGDGNSVLSRAGALTVSSDGFIVNPDGQQLLGDGGPIAVGGGNVSVNESGQVEVDNTVAANIRVVNIEDPTILVKVGKTSFMVPDGIEPAPAVNIIIRQGYLESSNVNVVEEMIGMITSYRNFEADAKAVQAQDDSLEKLFNNVGRV
nr:flagellar hook-basal body protein [candidate division Zixibacteria bacterium]